MRPNEALAAEVRRLRVARGMTVVDLTSAVKKLGSGLSRQAVTRIEAGERPASIEEVSYLARALGVPPILLFIPLGRIESVAIGGEEIPSWPAVKWWAGEAPYPTRHDGRWVVADQDWDDFEIGAAPLDFRRDQARLFSVWNDARRRKDNAAINAAETQLRALRTAMRRAGLNPGGLTDDLAHVDDSPATDTAEMGRHRRDLTVDDPDS